MDKTVYIRTVECKVGNNLARVHHKERTPEEQVIYQQELERALQSFGKEMVRVGLL